MISFLLTLLLSIQSHAASPWEGSWGAPAGEGQPHALTLRSCNANSCSFLLRTSACSMEGRAELKGGSAKLVPSGGMYGEAFTPNTYGCSLSAKVGGNEIRIDALTPACEAYCTSNENFPKVFPRLSEKPFNDRAECFRKPSPAWLAWCTSETFNRYDEELRNLQIKAEAANEGASKQFDENFVPKTVASCEGKPNPIGCLEAAYAAEKIREQKVLEGANAQASNFEKEFNTPGSESEGDALIGKIDGVYKVSIPNASVDGTSYKSEDILELVRVSKSSVYFKLKLNFYNGHECNLFGLAKYSAQGSLNYKDEDTCRLLIRADAKEMKLDDHGGTCSAYCGARGSLSNVSFPLAKRRPIKYMDRLKASEDYKKSVKP